MRTAATTHEPANRAVPVEQRLALLAGVPAFAALSPAVLHALAVVLQEEQYRAGTVIVAEGELGDRLFLLVEGQAEVSGTGPAGSVPLATLGPGELFGELALLASGGRREATVTAITPLHALSLAAPAFQSLLAAHAEARAAFVAAADTMRIARFLKQASPFASLDGAQLRSLTARLEHRTVEAGQTIVRQGDPGDTCFLLRSGQVEVLAQRDAGGSERHLATLRPGALFGEAALLTDAPRNATVRALERCTLLALHRADLLATMRQDRQVSTKMLDLLRLHVLPVQAPGVTAHHRTTATRETITTLKDRRRGAYYRLSPQGWFIWQRLDGHHTMRDLALEYFKAFKSFAPQMVVDLVARLAAAGFVVGLALSADVRVATAHGSLWQRALQRARRVMEWSVFLRHVDARFTRVYRGGVYLLYTRIGQAILLALAVAGLVAFVLGSGHVETALATSQAGAALLLFLIPANIVSTLVHEAGHAFTTKAFGYEVPRVGLGWYWFAPVAFVDTSDMWLAERWPRIAVSLAGPYAELVLGGIAALAAAVAPGLVLAAALWQFALASYASVLINLNPLLEFDGYFILMDYLEHPNLRQHALAWLGGELPSALRSPARLRAHWLYLLYGLASLLYIAVMAGLVVVLYRLLVQRWLAHFLPVALATGLGWLLAGLLVLLTIATVLGDLRGMRRTAPR